MQTPSTATPAHWATLFINWGWIPGALALAAVALALAVHSALQPPPQPTGEPGTVASNSAIEDRWGVRFTMVGVTADSGMLDVRYQVLDPNKAFISDDLQNVPQLVAEPSGTAIVSLAQMPNHNLELGHIYTLLYRNTQGAVRPGTPVTIQMGDLHVEAVAR